MMSVLSAQEREKQHLQPVQQPDADWITLAGVLGLVSIIVPTFNRALLLIDLLESLAAQTYQEIEILIVDDGSTDDTQDKVAAWASSYRAVTIKLFRTQNTGPSAARNLGLRHAKGEYIYFIDSDDLIFPKALEAMVSAIQESGRPYCLANIRNADINSTPIPFDVEGIPRFDPGNPVSCGWMMHSALYHRDAIIAAGAFNETLRCGEDTEHSWRVVAINGPCAILDKTIGLRRIHSFGHLSVGRTDIDKYRHSNSACLSFVEWATSCNVLNRRMSLSLLRNLLSCAINLGAHKDWQSLDSGQQCAREIGKFNRIWYAFFIILTRPKFQSYYVFLLASINIIRAARNSLRWLNSCLQVHRLPTLGPADSHHDTQ